MHVDDFISNRKTDKYASWVLMLMRLPATEYFKFKEFIEEYPLYCTFKGVRSKVTGASGFGDILIYNEVKGTHYVDVNKCSNFSDTI